jgi:hypothetical protein
MRRPRFSIRGLMVLVAVIGIGFASVMFIARWIRTTEYAHGRVSELGIEMQLATGIRAVHVKTLARLAEGSRASECRIEILESQYIKELNDKIAKLDKELIEFSAELEQVKHLLLHPWHGIPIGAEIDARVRVRAIYDRITP